MSRNTLPHFHIGTSFGGNQSWFIDPMMHLGGCGAATACDVSIILARDFGLPEAYPFRAQSLSRRDYVHFAMMMKPYLRPRWSGINTLEIYMDGFRNYLTDRGISVAVGPTVRRLEELDVEADAPGTAADEPGTAAAELGNEADAPGTAVVSMSGLSGHAPLSDAADLIRCQIDTGLPVPTLILYHQAPELADFVWHWFLITGYDEQDGRMLIQTATYGESQWFPLSTLWDTGSPERGGLVKLHVTPAR